MIDSHLHIDAAPYQTEGVGNVLRRAGAVGVGRVVAPALNFESYQQLVLLSREHPTIYPAAGVHPHEASKGRLATLATDLENALATAQIPVVGETGLEGFYDFVPMEVQLHSLRLHLQVAAVHDLPVILHCRDAEELLYRELLAAKVQKGVVHCFTGDWSWAQRFLELGFYIGITGIVTFKKSTQVQDVATRVPDDKLLVETDGPYLAPIPFRGKLNLPEYIPHIVRKVAELREAEEEAVGEMTGRNAERLFGLPKLPSETSV